MGSNGQEEELKLAIAEYESQLLQIKAAMTVTNFSGPEYDSLLSLQKDVTELIQLTKENLQNLEPQLTTISVAESPSKPKDNSSTSGCNDNLSVDEEFARFKAEIQMLENGVCESGDKSVDNGEDDDEEEKSRVTADIKNELAALQGTKCQAPYVSMKWDNEEKISYHNALVMSVEAIDASTSDIQDIMVRVMFVNPVHKKMVPCPYYLEGDCKFPDDKCHYSHGECIPFATLKEYREPDFSSIKVGSQVLAKHKDNLWHHANVLEIISDDLIKVKFNTSASGTLEIDLHEVLPLEDNSSNKRISNKNNLDASQSADPSGSGIGNDSSSNASDESSDENGDNEDDETAKNTDRDAIVQLSLLRTPASSLFADWEKHTRGIGSRMMANMGYIVGSGLGPKGDGRLEPVEALVFPPGKSLDHCMNLRESSGGDPDMFKAEKRRLKMQVKDDKRREKEYEREKQKVDLFSFINVQLSGNSSGSKETTDDVSKSKTLASSSRKGLNVERFRISEDIRKAEKNLIKLKESLKRHQTGSAVHKHITTKVNQAETELNKLQASEQSIAREQNRRDSTKKLSVF